MDINPSGILLVKSDSKGHRLLFRYPFINSKDRNANKKYVRNSPYSLQIMEDTLYNCCIVSNAEEGLNEFTDELLSTLFAVKSKFCEHKFELKVNNIRFVGHPACIEQYSKSNAHSRAEGPSSILIHIVFALRASADYSVVKSYYELSKRLGIAIRHEEKRCGYFSEEMKLMMAAHDMYVSYSQILKRSKNTNSKNVLFHTDLSLNLFFVGRMTTMTSSLLLMSFLLNAPWPET